MTTRSSTSDGTSTTRSLTSAISSTLNVTSSSIGVTVGTARSTSTLGSTISSTETSSLSGFNSTIVSSTLNGTPIGVVTVIGALSSTPSSTLNGTLSINSTVSSISNGISTTLIGNETTGFFNTTIFLDGTNTTYSPVNETRIPENWTYNSTNSHVFTGGFVPTQNDNSSWNISDLFIDEGFEEETSTRATLKAIVNKDIYPLFNNHSVQTLIHIWFGLIILCCCLGVVALFVIRYHYKKKEREAIANIHREFAITRVEVVEYNSNGRFKAKNNAPISVPFSDPELW